LQLYGGGKKGERQNAKMIKVQEENWKNGHRELINVSHIWSFLCHFVFFQF